MADESMVLGFPQEEEAPDPAPLKMRNHVGSIRMGGSSGDFMRRSFSLLGNAERMKKQQERAAKREDGGENDSPANSKSKPPHAKKSRWKRFRNSVRKAATSNRPKAGGGATKAASRIQTAAITKQIEIETAAAAAAAASAAGSVGAGDENVAASSSLPPPKPTTAPVFRTSPSKPIRFHQQHASRSITRSPNKRAYNRSPIKRLNSRVSSSKLLELSPSKSPSKSRSSSTPAKPAWSPTPSAKQRSARSGTILVTSPPARARAAAGAAGAAAGGPAADAAAKPAINMKVEVPKIAKLLLDRAIERSTIVATKVVGSGQFGKVYLAKQKLPTGKWVARAVKVVVGDANPENDAMFVRETATLAPLDHPNINKLVGVCFSERPWLAVLELAEYGDLRKCLQNFRRKRFQLHPLEQLHLVKQIASGLQYLHSVRMVHRDIALRNILLGTNSCAKIADFGHARKYDEGKDSFLMMGTERVSVKWAPIEIFTSGDKHFNESTDVWSFGVTMWEVLSYSKNPYETLQPNKVPRAVKDGFRLPNPGCPTHIHKFMLKCWEENPADRLRFSQVVGFIGNRMTAIQANDPNIQIRDVMAEYCKKHTNITKTLTGVVENETPTTPFAERAIPATPVAATPIQKMSAAPAAPAAPAFGASKVQTPSNLRVGETASVSTMPTHCNECTSELIPGNWYKHNDCGFGVCRKCYYTAFSAEQAQTNFTWVDVNAETAAAAAAAAPAPAASPAQPVTPGARPAHGGSLRRVAMTRGATKDYRLTALAQAMDGISSRKRNTLKTQSDVPGSPQAPPWTPPPSSSAAFDSPLVASTPTVSKDSPALFFAAPPTAPAEGVVQHVDL